MAKRKRSNKPDANGTAQSDSVEAQTPSKDTFSKKPKPTMAQDIPLAAADQQLQSQSNARLTSENMAKLQEELARDHKEILQAIQGKYSFIRAMLLEFWEELLRDPADKQQLVIESDANWFWFVEMKFLIIFIYEMAFMEFSMSVTKPDSISVVHESNQQQAMEPKTKQILSHRDNMQERVEFLAKLKQYVVQLGKLRLQVTQETKTQEEHDQQNVQPVKGADGKTAPAKKICKDGTHRLPRVFRLAKMYQLTEKETELFQLLVVMQGCQSNAVRCQMIEEDAQRKMLSCQRLASISEIDVVEFQDDQREHVKEGTLIVDEENYCTTLSVSNICVRVLLGRQLTSNQLLKLSQTALEDLLREEGLDVADGLESLVTKKKGRNNSKHSKRKHNHEESESEDAFSSMEEVSEQSSSEEAEDGDSSAFSFIGGYSKDDEKPSAKSAKDDGASSSSASKRRKSIDDSLKHSIASSYGIHSLMDHGEMKPYNPANQLEYLEDRFQVVAFAIRASGARVKDQMKEAGTKQMWESSAPASAGRRELKAKQRVYDRRTMARLALTRKAGFALPRMEELSMKFKLNKFEQNVIVMLIGKTISPVIKNLIDGVDTSPVQRMDESIIINQILSVFCDTFQEQVAHRVFFYKSSRLLSRGLVKLHRGRWHSTAGDLVDQRVELDRRVLDWVVGLDTEINELVEGSDLYAPKVQLDQVVLPEEHKQQILQTVKSYEAFRKFRKKSGLEDTISYGAGLVLLLCGASGTGKTMTVNAVAHHLKKRVLLVDFPSLQGKRQEGMEGGDADLRGLFREAEMSNAVLFFDECETIFKQRDVGGDRLLNALLTEIEKYEGIVFLATNRPFDLDEAMHRRITAVFEFKPPDHIQRRQIWQVLLKNSLKTAEDIDWDGIALKYELSGGFIKNAILSALLRAINRDAENPVINQEDIVAGCALQMRGSLHMKTFDHRVVPIAGLEQLTVEKSVKEKIQKIISFEKARSVIYGQWGFDFASGTSSASSKDATSAGATAKAGASHRILQQKGISALICGPKGVGKIEATKAIGFEIGKPLKLVPFAQIQSDSCSETRKNLRAVFDDARLMDAVLVLEGFETFGSHLEGASAMEGMDSPRFRLEAARLLDLMENFPGIVVLIANVDKSMGTSMLDSEFCRRLTFVIEMRNPNVKLREKIWRKSFPPKAPVADNVDFKLLAERYELSHAQIANAVFRGAANAALRVANERMIMMKDLKEAAEIEKQKARGSSGAVMDSLFV